MAGIAEQLVVVGVDGGAESSAALRWALKKALDLSATLEVVHCYPPGSLTDLGFSSPGELAAASAVLLEDEVQAALEEMPQTPAVTKSSVIGSPAQVLVQRTSGASLLVIGVHRQTDLSDLILGRVGRQCLRHARSPVVVVGPDPDAVRYETPSPTKTSVL